MIQHHLAAVLSLLTTANAAVLVDWNLNTVTGPTTNTAFTGVSSTVATVASHVTVSDLTDASSSAAFDGLNWSNFNTGPGKLNLWYWDSSNDSTFVTSTNGNGTPNNWLQFTITVAPGYELTLESINLAAWRNAAGAPANWRFDYFDGSAWQPFAAAHAESSSGTGTFANVTFNGSLTADDELTLRFVAYGTPGGTGVLHINQLVLNGTVSAVPEPSAALLGLLGAVALVRRRR